MPRPSAKQPLSKFQRYRASKRAKGMRLLRIRAPDVRQPGFVEEAERQAKLLEHRESAVLGLSD